MLISSLSYVRTMMNAIVMMTLQMMKMKRDHNYLPSLHYKSHQGPLL